MASTPAFRVPLSHTVPRITPPVGARPVGARPPLSGISVDEGHGLAPVLIQHLATSTPYTLISLRGPSRHLLEDVGAVGRCLASAPGLVGAARALPRCTSPPPMTP